MPLLPFGYAKDVPGSSVMPPTPVVFEPASPQKWEYRVINVDTRERGPLDEEQLGALGAEGWLLAGVVVLPGRPDSPYIVYHFVRAA